MKIINEIDFKTLSYYLNNIESISVEGGIYYWIYWPAYKRGVINTDEYIDKVFEYSSKSVAISKYFSDFKFSICIKETEFLDINSTKRNFLGLSCNKRDLLLKIIKNDEDKFDEFVNIFKKSCFMKPLYVGKADNLRVRLLQHFKEQTEILKKLRNNRNIIE